MAIEILRVGKCGSGSAPVRLIKGDNNTQKIQIQVQRYFGGVDLSALVWSVTVENAKGATDEYYVAHRSGEYVIDIEWIVKGTATAAAGLTKFKLSGYGGENLVWQSGTYYIRVEDTFEYVPGSETETALTEVQKLIVYVDGELQKVIAAGNDARIWADAANAAAQRAESASASANTAAGSAGSAANAANAAAESADSAAAAANAVSGMITNEFKGLVDRLTTPFAETGSIVTCHPVEGYPLDVRTRLEPVQAGAGEASPDNVRPIYGHAGAKVTRCGKNLLPPLPPEGNYTSGMGVTWKTNADGTVGATGKATGMVGSYTWTVTLPAGTYKATGANGVTGAAIRIGTGAGNTNPITSANEATFTLSEENIVHYQLYLEAGAGDMVFCPMIRLAAENDASYEPYQGNTFTASFGQTVYGGTLDWNTGVLMVNMALATLDGTEAMTLYSSANTGNGIIVNNKLNEKLYRADGLCSHFMRVQYIDTPGTVVIGNNTKDLIFPGVLDVLGLANTIEAFKAYLAAQYAAGTPVQIAYTLAKPYVIQLTPTQILALKGENTLWSEPGKTEVSGAIDPEYLTSTGSDVLSVNKKTGHVVLNAEDVGAQPKGDYALKSEIPTVPENVSAFRNDAGYLTQHQDISGKLDANKLPEAVNAALAQAKASGEFDGKDGTSPTVAVSDITDGHRITITDANGTKTVDVLDGGKGSDGRGIRTIARTSGSGASGTTDTYTITYTDGTTSTFGVYNGKDGTNGASVTVKSVSESTVDGGSNVVEFSDGKTVTIKNGSKGTKGDTGYTPQKGVDYATEADKAEMVSAVIAALPDASEVSY